MVLAFIAAGCLGSGTASSNTPVASEGPAPWADKQSTSGIRDRTLTNAGLQVSVSNGRVLPLAASLLSADGHRVAFATTAALVSGDRHDGPDVYLADIATGERALVSVGVRGAAPDGPSFPVGMSADGTVVLFRSWAHNLLSRRVRAVPELYVRDLRSGVTQLASAGPNGSPARTIGRPSDAALSRDGRYVAFIASYDRECGRYGVYLFDATRTTTRLVSRGPDGAPVCRPHTHDCNTSGVPFDTPVVSDGAAVIAYHQLVTGKPNPCANDRVVVRWRPGHHPDVLVTDRTNAMPDPANDTSETHWLTPSGDYIAVDAGRPRVIDLRTGQKRVVKNECNYTFPVALTANGQYAFWACQGFDPEYGDDPSLMRTDLGAGTALSVDSYLEDRPYRVTNLVGFTDDGRYVAFIDKHAHLYIRGPLPT
jgi:hypothetical protein